MNCWECHSTDAAVRRPQQPNLADTEENYIGFSKYLSGHQAKPCLETEKASLVSQREFRLQTKTHPQKAKTLNKSYYSTQQQVAHNLLYRLHFHYRPPPNQANLRSWVQFIRAFNSFSTGQTFNSSPHTWILPILFRLYLQATNQKFQIRNETLSAKPT